MSTDAVVEFGARWLTPLEDEMRAVLASPDPAVGRHYGMIQYHMGWVDEHLQPARSPSGKRLRPLFCLMACAAVGGDPAQALPAAAGVEILHNFSLVHDDIEDGDKTRRHRATVWALWGVPQAINVGDAMFALAFAALQRLPQRGVPAGAVMAVLREFTDTCIALTEGQHLDMSFEQRSAVSVDEYLRMIQGKTAALIGASVAIGAQIGGAREAQDAALRRFGQGIGLAFQIQDDILGIWGDPQVTGKPAGNDLLRRKKSLPLLYALSRPGVGAQLAAVIDYPGFGPPDLPQALALLDDAGAQAYAETQMQNWHARGRAALEEALGPQAAASPLYILTEGLLERRA